MKTILQLIFAKHPHLSVKSVITAVVSHDIVCIFDNVLYCAFPDSTVLKCKLIILDRYLKRILGCFLSDQSG